MEDLCRRGSLAGVNRRVLESLIKAGAFDCLDRRGTLLNGVVRVLSLAQREQKLKETGQSTMFDMFGETASVPLPELEMESVETPDREKAAWEKELLGVSFSEKPFSPVFSSKDANAVFIGNINAELDKQSIVMAGRIITARYQLTKKGETFAIATLEDFSGHIEVIAWPRTYAENEEIWKDGNEIIVRGKVRVRDDEISIACDEAYYYEPPEDEAGAAVPAAVQPSLRPVQRTPETPAGKPPAESSVKRRLTIGIHQTKDENADIALLGKIIALLREYQGKDEVRLNVLNGGAPIPLKLPNIQTGYNAELRKRLTELIGEDGLKVETV